MNLSTSGIRKVLSCFFYILVFFWALNVIIQRFRQHGASEVKLKKFSLVFCPLAANGLNNLSPNFLSASFLSFFRFVHSHHCVWLFYFSSLFPVLAFSLSSWAQKALIMELRTYKSFLAPSSTSG